MSLSDLPAFIVVYAWEFTAQPALCICLIRAGYANRPLLNAPSNVVKLKPYFDAIRIWTPRVHNEHRWFRCIVGNVDGRFALVLVAPSLLSAGPRHPELAVSKHIATFTDWPDWCVSDDVGR